MNQSFKKKVIAASVAATFVAIGAGFVAIPGIATISAAQANQFADTTQAVAVTAGVSLPVSTTAGADLTGQQFVITENIGGAITAGNIILTLTNGAKWVAASALTPATTGAGIGGKTAGNAATVFDGLIIDSANKANLVIPVNTPSVTGAGKTIAVSSMKIDTSAMTAGQTVSVSISSSSTANGVTTGVSTLLANVVAPSMTVTASKTGTTLETVPKTGATTITNAITVTEVIQSSIKDLSGATDEITVTLPSGYAFVLAPTLSADTLTTTVTSFSGNVAKFNVANTGTVSASAVTITPAANGIFVPSTATDGNVDATVTAKLANGTVSTSTVTLFKVASAATTNLAYTTGTTTAPTTYAALYAGRSAQSTGLDVVVKEVVGSTLLGGGTLSLTLPTGVTAGKNYAVTTDVFSDGTGVPAITAAVTAADGTADETGLNSIMATLAADSNGTAGKVTFKLDSLNLADTAVVGDLNVTVGGTANATAGTVKVATVIRATDSSVSGATPTVTAGSSLSLPDIVITESKAGALVGGGALMGVYIASANGANLTTTGATVTATKADGTDVSTTIFGAASATLTAGAAGLVTFPVTTASSSTTGPVTIKISGLKATVNSTATAGDITAVVGGASSTTDVTPTSDEGAKAFKQTVTVGKVVSATVPSIPAATATGTNTALTLSGSVVASGNDQGKIGTLFVVAVLPNGQVYSRDSAGAWTLWDGVTAFKSVSAGVTLGTHAVSILGTATDVSSIVGTQVYLGYGIGALGTSAYTNLLANATYNKVYTVQ